MAKAETAYRLGGERALRELRETGYARGIRPINPVAFRALGAAYLEQFERGYRDAVKATNN